jgi:hypothetical protein
LIEEKNLLSIMNYLLKPSFATLTRRGKKETSRGELDGEVCLKALVYLLEQALDLDKIKENLRRR